MNKANRVKDYHSAKPFPYYTTVVLTGKTPDYDRSDLVTQLNDQVDDSLKTRLVTTWFIFRTLKKPPVFDSLNIGRSRRFLTAKLHSLGYFNPVITDTFSIDTVHNKKRGDQQRVTTKFFVNPGKVMRLDSIGFALETPALQAMAQRTAKESLLKKGAAYSDQNVNSELDRLLGMFRDSGYYRFSKEHLYAERDTVVAALIDPTLDPFEQLQLLDSLKKKRENPTINVTIRQRPVKDSAQIDKYYFGDLKVYTDLSLLTDTLEAAEFDSTTIQGYEFFYSSDRFKLPFIASNIRLRPGSLYSQRRYYRVINTFNQLGAWQNVDFSLQERRDSVPLLDGVLRLYPAMKHSLNVDFETSRNVSDFLTQGSYFGLGLNFRLLNRNAYREAIQTSTNARFGIEIGSSQLVQTLQASLSHNIYFPKVILPKFLLDWFPRKTDGNERTIARRTALNLAAGYTDRRDFFRAPSVNTAWSYEWTRRRTRASDPDNVANRWTKSYTLTPFNFEYTNLHKTDSLIKLEQQIPAYRFAFNDGMIISTIFSITAGRQSDQDKRFTLMRARIEESGALFGFIKNLELGDLRRFVKIDGEIKHYINRRRSSWAFRAFGGFSLIYGKTDTADGKIVKEYNLPFFKAFFAGGPYSMRAWQVRRLGPGSSTIYDEYDSTKVDRFGNMQLEFNAEYRFNLTTIAGIKVNSALFVDIGNIWSKEFRNGEPVPEASFKLGRLYKDLAVGAGTSLRLDFEFFMIRLDWAYKIKNPHYASMRDGWFQHIDLTSGQLQLGIGYPF
ncbi:BamA/TamA family outer membrane protein [Paraflavitalea sp. CAU 1676]|uniref:BamA/TamA family outer membrane protein n=1 Tax=Paraflavitalea sp. CAU 1676 TaxID=3032598 RepID=UPI0023DB8C61|nr:BamA/TamA family outer membrane protein [Paraflavitalea sp. CAU 1676]MDF2190174.1 BamA/TamA family outer membrane protein [Paraflavitalea sp. CAU 1676]